MAIEVDYVPENAPFTEAENKVGELLPRGLTIKEMAESLHRSVKTVETHLGHIYQKLDVQNDKQAITVMFLRGIVKAKSTLLFCLVVSSAGNALAPNPAYAEPLINPPTEKSPVEVPDKRMFRGRQGLRSRINRSGRRWGRKQEQLWVDCFGEF